MESLLHSYIGNVDYWYMMVFSLYKHIMRKKMVASFHSNNEFLEARGWAEKLSLIST